ncbi:hypothetical protein MUK42_33322 [Musa troglodytarum]|uniref:Uncharacterized protein n=1 Tax=Musa troglodytarum TaxID=320322 RepID=A0A9E7F5A7_9LILI|nr:hypothetical protein MUK42_33322 [Musa troglodytarum]
MQRRWLMGWASPLAGSEEEAVAAWGPRKQSRKNMEEFYAEKPLLISMDHEWAYFDSADWALGMVSLSVHTKLFRAKTPRGHFDWIVKLQQEELAHKPKGPLWGTPTKVAVLLQRITRMTMLPISDFMLPIPVDLVSRQVSKLSWV